MQTAPKREDLRNAFSLYISARRVLDGVESGETLETIEQGHAIHASFGDVEQHLADTVVTTSLPESRSMYQS